MAGFAHDRLPTFRDPQERLALPFLGALLLHGGLIGSIFVFGLLHFHHGQSWGTESPGGAIQATLVSEATIPLPQDQKPTQNVLATETPSPAPAPPAPKAPLVQEEKAIPIPLKETPLKKEKKAPPQNPVKQPVPQQQYRAQYGQAAPPNVARATQGSSNANPVAVNGGDFGSRFGYYVSVIQRKVRENWYTQVIDPRTAEGTQAVVTFSIHRDGSVSDIRVQSRSNSPTLDSSGLQAVQRVDNFGPLPAGYNQGTVSVAYTFTYERSH
jgi:periplasmic protein TonB